MVCFSGYLLMCCNGFNSFGFWCLFLWVGLGIPWGGLQMFMWVVCASEIACFGFAVLYWLFDGFEFSLVLDLWVGGFTGLRILWLVGFEFLAVFIGARERFGILVVV